MKMNCCLVTCAMKRAAVLIFGISFSVTELGSLNNAYAALGSGIRNGSLRDVYMMIKVTRRLWRPGWRKRKWRKGLRR